MNNKDIIRHFEALKETLIHKFPNGTWVETSSDLQLGRFEVQFQGEKTPEVLTVYHTGNTNFQGSSTQGRTIKSFVEELAVADLVSVKDELFESGSRLQGLEAERQLCYQSQLPNATALLMKAILEDLWKEAFGNTGFDQSRMESAIDNEAITNRDVSEFLRIRGYGNGVSHSKPWLAQMNDIIGVQAKYEQLVSKLLGYIKQ